MAVPKSVSFQRHSLSLSLRVSRSLGPLNYLHLWHDNSGRGSSASWFVKYILVQDLQTMNKSFFICQRWLAVEEEDGAVRSQ